MQSRKKVKRIQVWSDSQLSLSDIYFYSFHTMVSFRLFLLVFVSLRIILLLLLILETFFSSFAFSMLLLSTSCKLHECCWAILFHSLFKTSSHLVPFYRFKYFTTLFTLYASTESTNQHVTRRIWTSLRKMWTIMKLRTYTIFRLLTVHVTAHNCSPSDTFINYFLSENPLNCAILRRAFFCWLFSECQM